MASSFSSSFSLGTGVGAAAAIFRLDDRATAGSRVVSGTMLDRSPFFFVRFFVLDGGGVAVVASAGGGVSVVSVFASTGAGVSVFASTGAGVSVFTSTGAGVSVLASTGAGVSVFASTEGASALATNSAAFSSLSAGVLVGGGGALGLPSVLLRSTPDFFFRFFSMFLSPASFRPSDG